MPTAKISPSDTPSVTKKSRQPKDEPVCQKDAPSDPAQQTKEPIPHKKQLTPFQQVVRKLHGDEEWRKEVNLEKRIGFYKIRGEIGTGNFSRVKLAYHCLTRERVAIKIMDKSKLDQKTQRMLSREVLSMESLHHPHIIRLFEMIETYSKIYLIMEYASGGELFHKISDDGYYSELDAKPLFAQIVDAVDHMHMHNIIHRDLKAENVFFSAPGIVKVGDFGFSTHIQSRTEPLKTFCGSPPYAAPELFQDDSYMGPGVDLWALGVLLYFMLSASMPFKSQTVSGLKKLIVEAEFDVPPNLSRDCQWLIQGLLRKNPLKRLTLQNIKKSRWISDQALPESLPMLNLQPPKTAAMSSLSKEELAARQQLVNLGVTDAMMADSRDRGVKSNVTGTYRIMLHKLLNPEKEQQASSSESIRSQQSVLTTRIRDKCLNKKSKTCRIL